MKILANIVSRQECTVLCCESRYISAKTLVKRGQLIELAVDLRQEKSTNDVPPANRERKIPDLLISQMKRIPFKQKMKY